MIACRSKQISITSEIESFLYEVNERNLGPLLYHLASSGVAVSLNSSAYASSAAAAAAATLTCLSCIDDYDRDIINSYRRCQSLRRAPPVNAS